MLPFWPLCCESEAKFRRSITKTEISVTGPAQLLIWTHRNLTKERVARRVLGNRASQVDWAHIKMPSFSFRHYHSVAKQIESPPVVKQSQIRLQSSVLPYKIGWLTPRLYKKLRRVFSSSTWGKLESRGKGFQDWLLRTAERWTSGSKLLCHRLFLLEILYLLFSTIRCSDLAALREVECVIANEFQMT